MSDKISVEMFVRLMDDHQLVDVRSPAEFAVGHIPGSSNLPLFDNNEREEIGTIYKQKGRIQAVERGLELTGPKMLHLVRKAREISEGKPLLVYCWRGGMRSASMGWLLKTAGMEVKVPEGGYKAFRQYGKSAFSGIGKLSVIGGFTGSGKTKVLKALENMGEQILDIEEMARHRGSSFGSIGQEVQKTNEQFENDLIRKWLTFDPGQTIWIEDESRILGSNHIPDELFERIRQSEVFKLDIPKDARVLNLVEDYAVFEKQTLVAAIMRIEGKLGGLAVKKALLAMENNDFRQVAQIILDYYDKTYSYGLSKRDQASVKTFRFDRLDPIRIAEELINHSKYHQHDLSGL